MSSITGHVGYAPWSRGQWHGSWLSADDAPAGEFLESDVEVVIAYHQSPDDWDGTYGAIIRLHDGRWVSWEGSWGPTGSGFSEDAYGGDTDVWFANSLLGAIANLSEKTMEDLWEQVAETLSPDKQAAYRVGGLKALKALLVP